MADTIQIRRGTTSAWNAANPVLALGEAGFDTTTKQFKVGDGTTAWTALAYSTVAPHLHSKIIYVDTAGNDSTAVVGREDLPFLTPLAAQTAATTGDTIVVRPGSYTGSQLGAVAGINWLWLPGTTYTNSTAGHVWNFSSGVFNVRGYGKFIQPTGTSSVVQTNTGTGTFEADLVEHSALGVAITITATATIKIRTIKTASSDAIVLAPANIADVMTVNVSVVDAGSDAVSLEYTAVPTIPPVVNIDRIVRALSYLISEVDSGTPGNAHIYIGTTVQCGENFVGECQVGSTTRVILGEYRHAQSDLSLIDGGTLTVLDKFAIKNGIICFNGPAIEIPTASTALDTNGQLVFETVSNTQVRVKLRGSDGVSRSTILTLS